MVVYLAREKSTENYLIDFAWNFEEALKMVWYLGRGTRPLRLIQAWEGDEHQKAALHDYFDEYAVGEGWFHLPPEAVVDLITEGFEDMLSLFGVETKFEDPTSSAHFWEEAIRSYIRREGHDPDRVRFFIPSRELLPLYRERVKDPNASYCAMWNDIKQAMRHPALWNAKKARMTRANGLRWMGDDY